ncbi:MAG: acyl--CoA ligase [Proteobacteria bacterium]|nr:acyl--CoA ligase [Pseudomonadota bacterium]MBI3496931.1 acyl--CoA ligase [Pseudomonadota bacterium]
MTLSDKRANNLGYYFSNAAIAHAEKVALIDLSGSAPREIAYALLDERHDRFAALMSGLGLKPGDRMAMAVGNRFEFVEIMYGAMRAGVVPVPLNTKLAADTLDYTMKDAGCVAAVVEPGANPHMVGLVDGLDLKVKLAFAPVPQGWLDYERELAHAAPEFDPPAIADDHPSFQPYTSGSTGRPKGVVLTHEGQLWWIRCLQKYWPGPPDQRALAAVPLYHKNAMAGAIKPMLQCGGSVVILPNFEPRRFLQVLSDYRCTHAGGVPAVFTLLLQQRDLIASLDFSYLQALKIGSAPTPKELMDAVEAAFGVKVSESYGLTEGGPVMIGPPLDGREVPHGSCGVAWPEGEIKLASADGRASGSYGELWVKNPGVTPGYHGLPEVNRQRIVDGWLKTGDLFSRDAGGFYYFRGRTDDMFNCGGENVYPLEVENLLLKHPAVADVSVVPVPHKIKGEAPVAMVVLANGKAADETALKSFCLSGGPAYAHPRRVFFVDDLPLNGAGKTDRKVVQKQVLAMLGEAGLGGA